MGQEVSAHRSANSPHLKRQNISKICSKLEFLNIFKRIEILWTHRMEALHLPTGLAIDLPHLGLVLLHGGDVGPPQRGQVQDRHQVLIALGRHCVQVAHQTSVKGSL